MAESNRRYAVGDYRISQSRTITESDIRTWAGLVFDFTSLHVDSDLMRASMFGQPIAHGYIAMNLSVGLFFPEHARWYAPDEHMRTSGWRDVRFTAPVFADDTLHCRRTVEAVDAGEPPAWVRHLVEVVNQDGVVVMSGHETLTNQPPAQGSG
jgi:3-hydroxybutyryl-CoA dehydratase